MTSIQTGHSHIIMRVYIKNKYIIIQFVHQSIPIILSKAIIYYTFIFYLNNFGNLNFIKYYVVLISIINTTSTSPPVYRI